MAAPFVVHGAREVTRIVREKPQARLLLGASGAFTFVLSAIKLPSVTGSSSHPTGTGLGAILFRPPVMALRGTIVLLFQALLLAHPDPTGGVLASTGRFLGVFAVTQIPLAIAEGLLGVLVFRLLLGPARVPARLLARAGRGVTGFLALGALTLTLTLTLAVTRPRPARPGRTP